MKKLLIGCMLPCLASSQSVAEIYRLSASISTSTINSVLAAAVESGAFNRSEEAFLWTTMKARFISASVEMMPPTQMRMNVAVRLYTHVNTWPLGITDTRTINFPVILNPSVQNTPSGKLIRVCPEAVPFNLLANLNVEGFIIHELNKIFDNPSSCQTIATFGTVLPNFPSGMIAEPFQFFFEADRLALGVGFKKQVLAKGRAGVDYDGDGNADVSEFNGDNWVIDYSFNGFGTKHAVPVSLTGQGVPGDYDGDGITDIAVMNASTGTWSIDYAADGFGNFAASFSTNWGGSTLVPVPADYDGDGITDLAVINKNGWGSFWAIDFSSNGFGALDVSIPMYIGNDYHPVPADYDGDGKADMAFKDDVTGHWMIDYRVDGYGFWNNIYVGWGDANFLPAPADFDGDGKADLAVVENGGYAGWWIDYAIDGFQNDYWNAEWFYGGIGTVALTPAPGDYDGDGIADLAGKTEWGLWIIDYSSNGFEGVDEWLEGWGGAEYKPLRKPVAEEAEIKQLKNRYNLTFVLPRDSRVTVMAYSLEGKRIASLYEGRMKEGENQIGWSKADLAVKGLKRGMYLFSLQADGFRTSKKVLFSE